MQIRKIYRVTCESAEALSKNGLENKLRYNEVFCERALLTDNKEEAEACAEKLNRGKYEERGCYGTIYCSKIAYVEDAADWEVAEFEVMNDEN